MSGIQRVTSWNNDVKWIRFVCVYLSIAVSLSPSSPGTPSFLCFDDQRSEHSFVADRRD